MKNIKLKEVVSYATRKMRQNETNGVEHIFISPEESKEIQSSHEVLAYTKIGEYEYFVTDIEIAKNNVYIIDPNGVIYLKDKNIDKDLKVIYINVPKNIREERAKVRSDYETAYKKRCASENKQFTQFESDKNWDIMINNIDFDVALNQLIKYIRETYTDNTMYLIVGRTASGKDSLIKAAKHHFNN